MPASETEQRMMWMTGEQVERLRALEAWARDEFEKHRRAKTHPPRAELRYIARQIGLALSQSKTPESEG